MKKKLSTELSNEELLKLLEEGNFEKSDEVRYTNNKTSFDYVVQFLQAFDIKDGEHVISDTGLYKVFRGWADQNCPVKNKFSFVLQLNVFLTPYYSHSKLKYKINIEKFKLFSTAFNFNTKNPAIIRSYRKHIDSFFKTCGVKPGDTYIEDDLLYHMYDTWVYNSPRKRQLNKMTFNCICKLHFKFKILKKFNTKILYAIDEESIKQHLPEEVVRRWRNGKKIEQNGKILYQEKPKTENK